MNNSNNTKENFSGRISSPPDINHSSNSKKEEDNEEKNQDGMEEIGDDEELPDYFDKYHD